MLNTKIHKFILIDLFVRFTILQYNIFINIYKIFVYEIYIYIHMYLKFHPNNKNKLKKKKKKKKYKKKYIHKNYSKIKYNYMNK